MKIQTSTRIEVIEGDITKFKIDAIVNAANKTLLGGGGVDGAIHRAAGEELDKECKTLNGCKSGEAKITKGYNLPVKYVIHTVGPIYGHEDNQEAKILSDCYKNCLDLAKAHKLKSIAFPSISTGAFRYPKDEAAEIAVKAAKEFVKNNPGELKEIVFVLFDELNLNIYQNLLS